MLFKEEEFNEKETLVLNESENKPEQAFEDDDVAMGCTEGCWSGCIGTCRRFQH